MYTHPTPEVLKGLKGEDCTKRKIVFMDSGLPGNPGDSAFWRLIGSCPILSATSATCSSPLDVVKTGGDEGDEKIGTSAGIWGCLFFAKVPVHPTLRPCRR